MHVVYSFLFFLILRKTVFVFLFCFLFFLFEKTVKKSPYVNAGLNYKFSSLHVQLSFSVTHELNPPNFLEKIWLVVLYDFHYLGI